MSRKVTHERTNGPLRRRRGAMLRVEVLERKALLATTTFTAPSLTDLIRGAYAGHYTAPAAINRELTALQTQLTSGPLADLNSGAATPDTFTTEVSSLLSSFDQQVDSALLPAFPNVDNIIKLNGARLGAELSSIGAKSSAGLITTTTAATQVASAISGFNSGPISATGTTFGALATRTKTFENDLTTLAQTIGSTSTPTLTLAQAGTVFQAEAVAYQADVDSGLYGHPTITGLVDTAISNLVSQVGTIASGTSTGTALQSQLQAAFTTFDNAVLDTTGVFGPRGIIARLQAGR